MMSLPQAPPYRYMFTEIQIIELLANLLAKRPFFHSEADFQHELAWLIHQTDPLIEVRLEKPLTGVGEVDILLLKSGRAFLIELKYKTIESHYDSGGETFALKSHGAQPLGRYDGLKDISRIENSNIKGCTIFLTNESQYWNVAPRGNGSQFSLQQGCVLQNLNAHWQNNTNIASIGKSRIGGIMLAGPYSLHWRAYGAAIPEFRYLLVMV